MKHGIRKLALVLVLALLLSTAALAAEATVEIKDVATNGTVAFHPNSTTQLTVTKTDAQNGGMYLVLVLAGAEGDDGTPLVPTASNILYINQATATGDGTVTFDNVYPSTIKDSTVYLSGTGLTGLTKMGFIDLLVMLGDVDGNQAIQIGDAAMLMRYIAKIDTSLSEEALAAADIDGNGAVQIGDAALLMRYIAKISPVLGQ